MFSGRDGGACVWVWSVFRWEMDMNGKTLEASKHEIHLNLWGWLNGWWRIGCIAGVYISTEGSQGRCQPMSYMTYELPVLQPVMYNVDFQLQT